MRRRYGPVTLNWDGVADDDDNDATDSPEKLVNKKSRVAISRELHNLDENDNDIQVRVACACAYVRYWSA